VGGKEAELDEKEAEYIRQVTMKEIDEEKFQELIGELDVERAMEESIAEAPAMMQATMQDEEIGESEWEESAEEEPAAAEKVVESLTIRKGKRKAAPARAKVYVVVEGLVSGLTSHSGHALMYLLTVKLMPDAQVEADLHHQPSRAALQEMPDGQEPVHLEGEELRGR
jgi:hypothetical protein